MDKIVINNDEFFGKVVALLEEGKSVTIPVKGFSMLPFIRGERDLVELVRPDREYAVGDIVLFRYCGRYVMHRIVAIEGEKVTIMGDGVPKNREIVTKRDLCGLVVKILRDGKRAVDPFSPYQVCKARRWGRMLPSRGYLLAIYRRLPWNWFWLRRQYRQVQQEIKVKEINNDEN